MHDTNKKACLSSVLGCGLRYLYSVAINWHRIRLDLLWRYSNEQPPYYLPVPEESDGTVGFPCSPLLLCGV